MLSFLEKSGNLRRFQGYKCLALRYFTTEPDLAKEANEFVTKARRYAKRETEKKSLPGVECFVKNVFGRVFDKKLLVYPSVLNDEEIDSMLRHSVEVEDYVNGFVKPDSDITPEIIKGLNEVELLGLTIPQKYGGLGYSVTESKFIQECLGVRPKVSQLISHNEDFGIKVLTLCGSEEQKQKYLPKLASGKHIITVAFLEEGPLVDIKSIQSSSLVDSTRNGFILNGKKKWVKNANLSDIFIVVTQASVELGDDEGQVELRLFIVEKNTPGLKIHKLTSSSANDFGFYEVDLENVFVPKNNQLNTEISSFEILKKCFSHSALSSAVLCSSLVKRMIHSALHFCKEKKYNESSLQQYRHIQYDMVSLNMFSYVLESVIYLVCGRLDTFQDSDLFLDAILAKILAVDTLNAVIQKYSQIIGPDSYRQSGILEEAVKILQYCSVFDENNSHLKLLVGSSGFIHSAKFLREKVLKLKKPFDYPKEKMKWSLVGALKKIEQNKKNIQLKMELHASLSPSADLLEQCLAKFQLAVEQNLFYYGNVALEEETVVAKFAEMAAYLLALTATLSRASHSYCNCFDNSDNEINICSLYAKHAMVNFDELYNGTVMMCECIPLYRQIGLETFSQKGYVLEHPLARTY